MGWFNQSEKRNNNDFDSVPELPRLPELPRISTRIDEQTTQLPTLPSNPMGNKFSQNMMREAISREKEGGDEADFDMKLPPLRKPIIRETPAMVKMSKRNLDESDYNGEYHSVTRKAEPIFIRIDKFEESLNIFEKAKKQIMEMEKMLKDIKMIKEEEEKELESWENEIKKIKEQIQKIDEDIFSRIE